VNTLIAACILAGAASVLPAFIPYLWLTLISAGVYGIGLGAVTALHIKTTTVFHAEKAVWHPDMPARAAMMMALGGVSAFAGILVSAIVTENMRNGVKFALGIAGGCLVAGGVLIAVARWRRCAKFRIAI
jgi:MFS family permease